MSGPDPVHPDRRLGDVTCPRCGTDFRLTWNDDSYHPRPATLDIDLCNSAEVVGVTIRCPHCKYEEPLEPTP